MSVDLRLRTSLLLRSGLPGESADDTIERTSDGRLHVSGLVWAGLLRRALARTADGRALAKTIGKYETPEGVSPLWCESSLGALPGADLRPGIRIDRKWGVAAEGALYQEEAVPPGLTLRLNFNFFCRKGEEEAGLARFAAALWVIDQGIENIGGGWSYGFGRLAVASLRFRFLDLVRPADRELLWRFDDDLDWTPERMPKHPAIAAPWMKVTLQAGILPGQLLAVHSRTPSAEWLLAAQDLPDSFVFTRRVLAPDGTLKEEPVIPGKAIRQALIRNALARKFETAGEGACPASGGRAPSGCACQICRWFGNGQTRGIIAVIDAPVRQAQPVVLNRVQLCEHSLQNMNLFNGEYLCGGEFEIEILVDGEDDGRNWLGLAGELRALAEELKDDGAAPPGWHRIGATAACTGQVRVTDIREERFGGRHD
jgi:hypothetical protein